MMPMTLFPSRMPMTCNKKEGFTMKIKAALIGAFMVAMSLVFAACSGTEDGKITTEGAGTSASAVSTSSSTTKGMMNEMSSMAGDVSEGLSKGMSEAGSELRKGITRMYQ